MNDQYRNEVLERIAELERRIAVQRTWLDGTQIECKALEHPEYKWMQVATPNWDWDNFDYRVCKEVPTAPAIYVPVFPNIEQTSFPGALVKEALEIYRNSGAKIVKYIPCEDEE